MIQCIGSELLRGHVQQRARTRILRVAGWIKAGCQAKVCEVWQALAIEQDVGRFQIQVDDALLVGEIQRTGNRFACRDNLTIGKRTAVQFIFQ